MSQYLRNSIGALALGSALLVPPVASAHPHVFVDAGLEIIFDDEGRLAGVQVVWVYDELFSMFEISDLGLDPDFSGSLTDQEREELRRIYSNWDPDFDGDLYVSSRGTRLELSRPLDVAGDLRDDRMVIVHLRAFSERIEIGAQPVLFRIYDPTYFVKYAMSAQPTILGRDDCRAEIRSPDLDRATERLEQELDALEAAGADALDIEMNFPEVGEYFADEVRLTCATQP